MCESRSIPCKDCAAPWRDEHDDRGNDCYCLGDPTRVPFADLYALPAGPTHDTLLLVEIPS